VERTQIKLDRGRENRAASGVSITVNKLKQFRQFLGEVWAELKKTTWPGRQEVYGTTVVVIVTVLICASFLWVVDMMLNKGMEVVFRMSGQ
jgi:preprotein translocase subunit SecE